MDSKQTCETCEFWEQDSRGYSVPSTWGACLRIPEHDEGAEELGAVTFDSGGSSSGLLTAPTFGCTLWGSRE